MVLHTHAGFVAFDYIGKKISDFISFAADGTKFVFGTEIIGNFAFGVLPIIIYFSMFTSMLYYLGFMQYVIKKVSWLFTVTCGTTAGESMGKVSQGIYIPKLKIYVKSLKIHRSRSMFTRHSVKTLRDLVGLA